MGGRERRTALHASHRPAASLGAPTHARLNHMEESCRCMSWSQLMEAADRNEREVRREEELEARSTVERSLIGIGDS
jgi:hypothetical protein